MSEREEEVLSVVASTWSDDTNADKTDGYETVDETQDMEGDWKVIDEIGVSRSPYEEYRRHPEIPEENPVERYIYHNHQLQQTC